MSHTINLSQELEKAVRADDIDRARYLVKVKGADPEDRSFAAYPLLHIAADAGYPEMARFLVQEAGVSLWARDEDGYTALEWAFKLASADQPARRLVAREIEDGRRRQMNKPLNP